MCVFKSISQAYLKAFATYSRSVDTFALMEIACDNKTRLCHTAKNLLLRHKLLLASLQNRGII